MRKIILGIILSFLIALSAAGTAHAGSHWQSPTRGSHWQTPAQTLMLELVNQDRANSGIAPVTLDPHLTDIAEWRANDMVGRHYFAHVIPGLGGCMVFCVMNWQHINYDTAGENIIWSNEHLIEPMVQVIYYYNDWWMHSPEHRRNILDPQFKHIGIGYCLAPGGFIYGVEDFTG